MAVTAIEPVAGDLSPPEPQRWQPRARQGARAEVDPNHQVRLCQNSITYQACTFTVAAHDPHPLCISCRQTRMLPDLSIPENVPRWIRIESAKRRLLYSLLRLGLAHPSETDGPVYQFLADLPGHPPVMTGHENGVITLNVLEADDDERARRRVQLREPYRTLLGHLRHESGHYYWDRLVRDDDACLMAFRHVFGDERQDYVQALQAHYAGGNRRDAWEHAHVSAYATAHPWEDWAETWAHYLHMTDLLETAAAYQTRIVMPGSQTGDATCPSDPFDLAHGSFDASIAQWVPVTLLLNSLNRSLGHDDAYPFALGAQALDKLRFVHDVIARHSLARTSGHNARGH
jgi:hypothetical protein